jgi:ATP adenylyltransferase
MRYIEAKKPAGCIFCDKLEEPSDAESFILFRSKDSFIMMNIYPYNTGHLMVIPYRHAETLEDLPNRVLVDLIRQTKTALQVLRQAFAPGGFNVGMNLGKAAGAGIEEHLHIHIVPRWNGDTNFMPLLADTKVIPQDLRDTYATLSALFQKIDSKA